ncbi:MAG: nucleotide exchange factor GrpE [Pseudomonadota bacterium]
MSENNAKTDADPQMQADEPAHDATQAEAPETEVADDTPPDLAAELDAMRDRLLRAVADAENTRKRAAREIKDTRDYAVTGFARDMLDVADNLSRALGAVDAEARANAGPALSTLLEGVELTEKRLLSTLERHGVKKLEPEPGETLDPNRHQAAAQVPSDQPKGSIAHLMQPGFVIGERTLRAAMVVVSAGPAEGAPPQGGAGDAKPGDAVDVSA